MGSSPPLQTPQCEILGDTMASSLALSTGVAPPSVDGLSELGCPGCCCVRSCLTGSLATDCDIAFRATRGVRISVIGGGTGTDAFGTPVCVGMLGVDIAEHRDAVLGWPGDKARKRSGNKKVLILCFLSQNIVSLSSLLTKLICSV